MRYNMLIGKYCNTVLFIVVWIVAYSITCNQGNSLDVFSMNNQDITIYFRWNCLKEFLDCLRTDVRCDTVISYDRYNLAFVYDIDRSYMDTSRLPKVCNIEPFSDEYKITCSHSTTHISSNTTLLMLRENKTDCFRTGFVPLNQWSIIDKNYVTLLNYRDYSLGVCTENRHNTTVHNSYHTTKTTLTSNVFNSVSTTGHTTTMSTVNIPIQNLSISMPNHVNDQGNEDNNALIISLCVVFGVLILIGVLVGLFSLLRKRITLKNWRMFTRRSEFDNNANISTTNSHNLKKKNKYKNVFSKLFAIDNNQLENVIENNIHHGNVSAEDSDKDDINYATYSGITINERPQNDIILTDGDGYLAPFREQTHNVAFDNSVYTVENAKDFDNSIYEDLDSINVQVYSEKPYTSSSDSMYDKYNSKTKLNCPEANTAYQNLGKDQTLHQLNKINPNNTEDKESLPGYEIQGIVLDEFGDMGESQDYENLENVNIDSTNHLTVDPIIDNPSSDNRENKNVYFILEENQ